MEKGLLVMGSECNKPAEYYIQNQKSRPKTNKF